MLPYRLEKVFETGAFWPIDLDGDGRDERVSYAYPNASPDPITLDISRSDGQPIDHLHYGQKLEGRPHFLDVDGDDVLETLVAFVRNDSLYASFVNYPKVNEVLRLPLTSGAPRPVTGGFIPWDPVIRDAFIEDVNHNGHEELVTIIATRRARLPRGVWIHSLSDRQLLGHYIVGAMPEYDGNFLGDFDMDGQYEVMLATGASDNGAEAGNMNDQTSYLFAFDLGIPPDTLPDVEWYRETGGLRTQSFLLSGELDGDGEDDFLAFTQTLKGRALRAQLQIIDPMTGDPIQDQSLDESITGIAIVNLGQDSKAEILALGTSGKLKVLNGELDIIEQRQIAEKSDYRSRNTIRILPDGDADGIDEILVETQDDVLFLDPALQVKAVFPLKDTAPPVGIIRQGTAIYYYAQSGEKNHVYRLAKNHFYLLNRYGIGLLWGGFAGLWIVLGFLIAKLHKERRKARELIEEAHDLIEEKKKQLEEARQLIIQLEQERQPHESTDQILGDLGLIYTIIATRYSDSTFGVERLASEMGWDVRRLQRYLNEKIDKKPSELIWNFRLDRAKERMDKHGKTARISEIAYAVGFKNPGHFSTRFKEAFGHTPSEYLKTRKEQEAS